MADANDSAFPQFSVDAWKRPGVYGGMSLLQFATIEIMKGLVSNPAIVGSIRKPVASHEVLDSLTADYAVRLANHTLKAMEARIVDAESKQNILNKVFGFATKMSRSGSADRARAGNDMLELLDQMEFKVTE